MKDHVVYLFGLAALAVIGIVVLKLAHQDVPAVLDYLVAAAAGGGAGAALPGGGKVQLDEPIQVTPAKKSTRSN